MDILILLDIYNFVFSYMFSHPPWDSIVISDIHFFSTFAAQVQNKYIEQKLHL